MAAVPTYIQRLGAHVGFQALATSLRHPFTMSIASEDKACKAGKNLKNPRTSSSPT